MATGNLNRASANTGAFAARQAGAHSTNMLNPGGFTMANMNRAQAPFAAQYGQLEAQGAHAQTQGMQDLVNMLLKIRGQQGQENFQQQQLDMNSPNFWTYLMGAGNLGANVLGIPGVL